MNATLVCMDDLVVPSGSKASAVEAPVNPACYLLSRDPLGERLTVRLFLDTSLRAGAERDARTVPRRLRVWMAPRSDALMPPRVLFVWGPERFAGVLDRLSESWTRFDADGTPTRGEIELSLRGGP